MQKQLDATRKSSPPIDVHGDSDEMDTAEPSPPGQSLEQLRSLVSAGRKHGLDEDAQIMLEWKAQIAAKQAEKTAAKPLHQRIQSIEQDISRFERQYSKMEATLQTRCEQLAAAEKAKEDHILSMAEVSAKVVRARLQRADLGTKLSVPAAAPPSQMLSLLVAASVQEADTISDDLRASVQAVISKLEAEHAAKELAKAEAADSAAEAAAAATAQSTSTATATTPAPTAQPPGHAHPPPPLPSNTANRALHASCSWPDGGNDEWATPLAISLASAAAVPDRGCEFTDEHLAALEAFSAGTASDEQKAVVPVALSSLRANRPAPY